MADLTPLEAEANRVVDVLLARLDESELSRLAADVTTNPYPGRVRVTVMNQLMRRLEQHRAAHLRIQEERDRG